MGGLLFRWEPTIFEPLEARYRKSRSSSLAISLRWLGKVTSQRSGVATAAEILYDTQVNGPFLRAQSGQSWTFGSIQLPFAPVRTGVNVCAETLTEFAPPHEWIARIGS